MASNPSEKKKLHIAMLPWLAFGHLVPYLELAKLLSENGHSISFISTPRNLQRLPKLTPKHSLISLIPLPLPSVAGLPPSAESTSDLPTDQVPILKLAFDLLRDPLAEFLASSSPDWLLIDFAPFWAPALASRLGIPTIFLSIFIASSMAWIGAPTDGDGVVTAEDFTGDSKPRWVPVDWELGHRKFEVSKLLEAAIHLNSSGVSDLARYGRTIRDCAAVAVRSSYEIEGRELKLLEEIHRKPVFPVGQLPPADIGCALADQELTDTWQLAKDWLDGQEKGSVVYVAFGSEATLDREELVELALGLEMSGLAFFWVLRAQKKELPEGFEERTRERGVIWTSWAPQLKILSHDSVVAMLNHSGWSSVVEAVSVGKPMILLTMSSDQGMNASLLESKKMAYVIPRDEKDGSFTKEAVAESLKLVVEGEEGEVYREKVKEMSGLIGSKEIQNKYTNNLISFLQSHKECCKLGLVSPSVV